MSIKKVAGLLRRNKNFLITSHMNPEGDALGSELALYLLLKRLKKKAFIVNEDMVPDCYSFLPYAKDIKRPRQLKKNVKFDCFVALDCSDLNRCGSAANFQKSNKPVINIDHHISNRMFADINWVDPKSSCTCEMVYLLYKYMKVPIDKNIALCLYAGILTDTGSFRYSNTTSLTHKIVAKLLTKDLNTVEIYKNIYENLTFSDMKLLNRLLLSMKSEARGRIIWFKVKKDIFRGRDFNFDLSERILSFGRAIKGCEVVVLFKENFSYLQEIRVNFRSQGKIDVNQIASFFGGGGHKTASGCTIRGSLDKIINKVIAKLKEAL